MIEKNEVLLRDGEKWLHFANPGRILSTTSVHEVRESLQEVERLVNVNGWHAAGFISYEAAPAFDRALRVLDAGDFPLLWFGLYPEPRAVQNLELIDNAPGSGDLQKDIRSPRVPNLQPSVERESYNTAIEKIKDYIARGRTYQVNYTMRLTSDFDGDTWEFFLDLVHNQNKYAGFIDTGDHAICSASPELFFELEGETITSRPMKGTVRRGRTTREDEEQASWLRNSAKNRAENVMIVDMIRNDIGRIAEIGSVTVPELFKVEKYPTLFQMTSTVRAKTKASLTDIFSALFPCGSITGAPKISTMKIISELETTPRRIYTGTIGYFSPKRRAQFNIAIRTALIDKRTSSLEYGVGGGIVWDSTSADEYDEALLKAQVLTERPREFSLLETILWTPDEGYFLIERHMERMADSAEYFDFVFSRAKVEAFMNGLARKFKSHQRVRVLSNRSGDLTGEAMDFQMEARPFEVVLAEKPVQSKDVFLFHKTTRREIYNNALRSTGATTPQKPGKYDEVLLYNERDELTEFTIGNLVVEINDELITPPVSCGLLPGTFRAQLLETGKIKERVVYKKELDNSSKIFMVNSVRRWVEVKLN